MPRSDKDTVMVSYARGPTCATQKCEVRITPESEAAPTPVLLVTSYTVVLRVPELSFRAGALAAL